MSNTFTAKERDEIDEIFANAQKRKKTSVSPTVRTDTGTSSDIATGFRGVVESIPLAVEDIVSDARLFAGRLGGGTGNPFEGLQPMSEVRQREDAQEFLEDREDLKRRIAAHRQKYAANQQTGGGLVGNLLGYGLLAGGLGGGRNLLLRARGRPTTVTGTTVPKLAATEAALIPTLGDDPFSLGDNRMGNMLLAAGVGKVADSVLNRLGNRVTTESSRRAKLAPDPTNISPVTGLPLPRSAQADITEAAQVAQREGYVIDPTIIRGEDTPISIKLARGVSGSADMRERMTNINQVVTNNLARKALGLSEDAPLRSSVNARLKTLSDEFDNLRQTGSKAQQFKETLLRDYFKVDNPDNLPSYDQFFKSVDDAKAFDNFINEASKIRIRPESKTKLEGLLERRLKLQQTLRGVLGDTHNNIINDMQRIINKDVMDPDMYIDTMQALRQAKSKLYATGDSESGRIAGEIADILEDNAETYFSDLSSRWANKEVPLPEKLTFNEKGQIIDDKGIPIDIEVPDFASLINNYNKTRIDYAKTNAVKESLTGDNVEAKKLHQINRDKKLTDELQIIADTYEYFGAGGTSGNRLDTVMNLGNIDTKLASGGLGMYTLASTASQLARPFAGAVTRAVTTPSALITGYLGSQNPIRKTLIAPGGRAQRLATPQPLGLLDRTLQFPNVKRALNAPLVQSGSRQLLAPALGAGTSTFAVDQTDLL